MYAAMHLPHLNGLIFKCDPCKLALWIDKNGEQVKEIHFRSQTHQIAVGENNIQPEDGHRCPLCNVFCKKKWVMKHIKGPEHQNKLFLHQKAIADTEMRLQYLFNINFQLQEFETYQEYDEAEEFVMDLFTCPVADETPDNEEKPDTPDSTKETSPKRVEKTTSKTPSITSKVEKKVNAEVKKNADVGDVSGDLDDDIVKWVAQQRLNKKPILLPNVMQKFGISREKALKALEKS